MKEEMKCYFPAEVKPNREFFTGYGGKELSFSAKSSAIGLGIAIVLYLIIGSTMFSCIFTLVWGAVSVGLVVRDANTNVSMLDEVKNLLRYHKMQKIWHYYHLDEWV